MTATADTEALPAPARFAPQAPNVPGVSTASDDEAQRWSRHVSALMAEAVQIPEVSLSPDGAWVAYTLVRGSVESNQYTSELLLQSLATNSEAVDNTLRRLRREHNANPIHFVPQWLPDGTTLSYLDMPSAVGASRRLVLYERTMQTSSALSAMALAGVGPDYRWSPSGQFLAFTVIESDSGLDPRRGVSVSAQWRSPGLRRRALVVVNSATGVVEQRSPSSLHVVAFDWSPDEREIVVAATEDGQGVPLVRSDLFVIDRISGAVRELVVRPGLDGRPSWSPDGQWIAFTTHSGFQTYYMGEPAIVSAVGGDVIRLGEPKGPKFAQDAAVFWASDSRSFYYSSYHHMTQRLIRVDVTARRQTPVSTDETPYDGQFSASSDARTVAFTRETLTRPPELFVQSAFPNGRLQQVTHLSERFPLTRHVQMDAVAWLASDGKFKIHGLLLTPASAWLREGEKRRIRTPLPLLVYLNGGPSMIRRGFAQDGRGGAMLPLAAHGYAVLAPNTRGRGGYGEAFQRALRDSGSSARLPYQDMRDGIAWLVEQGIADPQCLGLYGHSYGGYLTTYALTQTDAFAAAVIIEGGTMERTGSGMQNAAPGTDWALLMRDLHGVRNPYDPKERAVLEAESPLLHAARIRTPTLLLYGVKSAAVDLGGWPLFGALQRFDVPSELVIYNEGHVFQRPAALADSIERTSRWMDRWIRNGRSDSDYALTPRPCGADPATFASTPP